MRKTVIVPLLVMAVLIMSACMPVQAPAAMQAEEAPQPAPAVPESASDVPRIPLDEAKQHFDDGTALFVDARSDTDYEQAHIAGAMHLVPDSIATLGDTLPKDQLIITYCT